MNTGKCSPIFQYIEHKPNYYTIHLVNSELEVICFKNDEGSPNNIIFSIQIPKIDIPNLKKYGINTFGTSLCSFILFDLCTFKKVNDEAPTPETKSKYLTKFFCTLMKNKLSKSSESLYNDYELSPVIIRDALNVFGELQKVDITKISKAFEDMCDNDIVTFNKPAIFNKAQVTSFFKAFVHLYNSIILDPELKLDNTFNLQKIYDKLNLAVKHLGEVEKVRLQKIRYSELFVNKNVPETCDQLGKDQEFQNFSKLTYIPYVGSFILYINTLCKTPYPSGNPNDKDTFIERSNRFIKMVINKVLHLTKPLNKLQMISALSIINALAKKELNDKKSLTESAGKTQPLPPAGWWYFFNQKIQISTPKPENVTEVPEDMIITTKSLNDGEIKFSTRKKTPQNAGSHLRYNYKGHSYVLREGKNGGKYIVVKGKKKYIK